jgi:hypothetical protein
MRERDRLARVAAELGECAETSEAPMGVAVVELGCEERDRFDCFRRVLG